MTEESRDKIAKSWLAALRVLREEFNNSNLLVEVYKNAPQYHPGSVELALEYLIESTSLDDLLNWIGNRACVTSDKIAVLNASNIPFVGLRDLIGVSITGHAYHGVLSRKCNILLPKLVELLQKELDPRLLDIGFGSFESCLNTADRIIATGSDDTISSVSQRANLNGIPSAKCLFRGHKIGVGVLDDNPTSLDLKLLSQDILLYDGRGCRSIAILFVTRSFDLELLKEKLVEFRMQFEASQSCLESLILPSAFQEARASVSNSVFKKGRGFLLSEGPGIEQNAGHLRVVRYNHISEVNKWLDDNENKVQHLATSLKKFDCQLDSSNFGKSQKPRIDWDPDGDDLIAWLSI